MRYARAVVVLIVAAGAVAGVVRPDSGVSAAQSARQMPSFAVDPAWPQLPNKWVLGQTPGIAVDRHDHVWILHRPRTVPEDKRAQAAPAVLEFDEKGKFVNAWGGPGTGFDWPDSEHGIFVDYKDNVWIGGSSPTSNSLTQRSDDMLVKFTSKGKFLLQIGGPDKSRGNADQASVNKPADAFVYQKTNELFVADGYFNHRVIVFDADSGKHKRHWGAYGKPPDDAFKFPPRAQLIQGPAPTHFNNPVHGVLVSNDELVYVADRTNNRLQVFRLDGTYIKEVFIARNTLQAEGTVHNFALSPDREQKYLYVMDGSNKAIRVLDRQTLQIVSNIGGRAGHNAREFFHPHSFAADSKGNLFIGEVNDGQRYYRYAFKGMGPQTLAQ